MGLTVGDEVPRTKHLDLSPAESDVLRRFLRRRQTDQFVTSTLARVELVRAVLDAGPLAVAKARRQLSRLDQIVLSTELLDRAATFAPALKLRSLDAIHLPATQVIETNFEPW